MRIGIPLYRDELNGRGGWVAGLHYVKSCLAALATLPATSRPDIHVLLPESLDVPLLETAVDVPFVHTHRIPDACINAPDRRADLQAHIDAVPVDLVFPVMSPPPVRHSVPAMGWITDFQHRRLPDFFSPEDRAIRDRMFAYLGGYCETMACSSETVRADLAEFLPEAASKAVLLRFTAHIPPSALEADPREALAALGIDEPFCYLPNQFWIHKNHKTALEAWRLLAERGGEVPLLACTGNPHDYRAVDHYQSLLDFIAQHGLQDRVRMLGFIPRDQQLALYRTAALVLQPSLFEGWSTSIEEAKRLGRPMVVSDIPIHREQVPHAAFFPVEDAAAMADAVMAQWQERKADTWNRAAEDAALANYQAHVTAFGQALVDGWRQTIDTAAASGALPSKQLLGNLIQDLIKEGEACEARNSTLHAQLEHSTTDGEARLEIIKRYQRDIEATHLDYLERIAEMEATNLDNLGRIAGLDEYVDLLKVENQALRDALDRHHHPVVAIKVAIASVLKRLGLGGVITHASAIKRLLLLPKRLLKQPQQASEEQPPQRPIDSPLVEAFVVARSLCAGVHDCLEDDALEVGWRLADTLKATITPRSRLICPPPSCRGKQLMHMLEKNGLPAATLTTPLAQWLGSDGPAILRESGGLLLDVVALTPAVQNMLAARLWPEGACTMPLIITGDSGLAAEILAGAGLTTPPDNRAPDLMVYWPGEQAAHA